jgi:hypothetical protein
MIPVSTVRAKYRFWRFANKLSISVLIAVILLGIFRAMPLLPLGLAVLFAVVAGNRFDHWRTERLAMHAFLVGIHRGKRRPAPRLP